jgi:hypothetical protein
MVFVLMVLSLLSPSIQAQGPGSGPGFGQGDRQWRFEDMKTKRVAFFSERIGLTTSEAERFWPVYNSLQTEKEKLNERRRKLFQMTTLNNKGEKVPDYGKISDEMINIKLKEATLEKTYHDKFKKILSPEKMMKYYRTEDDWGRELLKQFQRRG